MQTSWPPFPLEALPLVDGETVLRYQAEKPLHGHVGLWTKADSVTLFNDLVIDDGIDHSLIQW
ncbi:MAG: hypothetical protein JZU50_00750 [Desulfobulbaceae bacterium]|nr:hypothetical protein [Desulfobulbaceae bacterium]